MRKWSGILLCVLVVAELVAAQSPGDGDNDAVAAQRVATLSNRLRYRDDDEKDKARYYEELPSVTRQLQLEIDSFIQRAFPVAQGSQQVQTRLRRILAGHVPNPQYGDLPLAAVANLRYGRSLVVAYTLVRPPHFSLAAIRAYKASGDSYRLADKTGDDFDGYDMFKAGLRAPLPDEYWLLAWGQKQTFNGKLMRFRLFVFDGERFNTIWSPEDLLDATLRLTGNGFVIDRIIRDAPFNVQDQYTLTINGPIKTN